MIKKWAKMMKVYGINVFFSRRPPLLPLKEYVLYTLFNVDNYGWPLSNLAIENYFYVNSYYSYHISFFVF